MTDKKSKRVDWERQYKARLMESFELSPDEAVQIYKANAKTHDLSYDANEAADGDHCLGGVDLLRVVCALGGKSTVLRALGWRPVKDVFPDSPLIKSEVPHWVPPYNPCICFAQDKAIETAFHSWVWSDMAEGRFRVVEPASEPA